MSFFSLNSWIACCGRVHTYCYRLFSIRKVTLFDTAGGERFRSLTRSYHRGKQAVILVYDVESNYTLDDLQQWIDEVERCSDSTDTTWAIFGNKCELEPKFEARILEGYRLELDTNLSFFVSAKTGANVQDAFDSVFAYVHRKATSGRLQVGPTVDEDDCTVDLQETNNGISATRNGRNRIRC